MENTPQPLEEQVSAPYTAWHYLLVQTLEALIDPGLLTILPFHKLGTLPLEADILLLLKEQEGPELARLVPDFDFMLRELRRLTVVEYKSPEDVLSVGDLETALCYALLAKRKHKVGSTSEMCLQCLYSYCERGLVEHFRSEGLDLVTVETGVMRGQVLAMPVYLINLVEISDRRPRDLVNLLSARHRRFVLTAEQQGQRAAILRKLYYSVFKEVRKMLTEKKLEGLQGAREVLSDVEELNRLILESCTPEERLRGLGPEERLLGLGPEERERLLQLLLGKGRD